MLESRGPSVYKFAVRCGEICIEAGLHNENEHTMNSLSDRYNALSLCYFGMTISMHDTVNISPAESYISGNTSISRINHANQCQLCRVRRKSEALTNVNVTRGFFAFPLFEAKRNAKLLYNKLQLQTCLRISANSFAAMVGRGLCFYYLTSWRKLQWTGVNYVSQFSHCRVSTFLRDWTHRYLYLLFLSLSSIVRLCLLNIDSGPRYKCAYQINLVNTEKKLRSFLQDYWNGVYRMAKLRKLDETWKERRMLEKWIAKHFFWFLLVE